MNTIFYLDCIVCSSGVHLILGAVGCKCKAKKKICGFPVSSYKNLGRVGRF